MTLFGQPAPRWFTIAPHRPFLRDLAEGLLEALAADGPQALSDAAVLVPSRRAARGLAEAFVEVAGGRALLLPQIRALGDLDEGEPPFEPGDIAIDLPPAISPWRRRFELARLVAENAPLVGRSLDATAALELADALGKFLDGVDIDEAWPLAPPADWVAAEMARHWQVSAEFLGLAVKAWPLRLHELGLIDVAARRVALTRALAESWAINPPAGVLIAAGSTGSTPATAALLSAVANAPQGLVVLPGLDQDLADPAWAEVGDQHPQGAMKRLLAQAGVERGAVRPWSPARPGDARGRWRRRIVNEALRPAEATADWLEQIDTLKAEGASDGVDPIAEGLAGLALISARNEEEAAQIAALALREVLETPGRTAALVTPDAGLARRVSARLARWGVEVDSSAGSPLAGFPVGQLTALVARQATDPVDPVGLLAILKHPLVRLGPGAEALERWGLRGARPRSWDDIAARLDEVAERLRAGLEEARELAARLRVVLDIAAAPYTGATATPAEAARALAQAMETLASGPDSTDPGALWAGAAGECAGDLIAALIGESDGLPEVTPRQFADLIEGLLAVETVRPGGAVHPRLRILGVLEARLIHADRLILGGLEEGVWPQAAPIDPFLSRPMREAQGLSSPERRIGLSAHDFAQAAGAGDVIMLTTARRAGAPATQSRWLWRLQTLARGAKVAMPGRPDLVDWARALDAPSGFSPSARPRPTPPVAARPRRLPVTGVETWVRDPYAIYARYILRLRAMERPAEPVEARARGSAVHRAFERFAVEVPDLGESAQAQFSDLLIEELIAAGMLRPRLARERALARRAAPWVVAFEQRRRDGARLLIEQEGVATLHASGGDFVVTARADRIEARTARADVLDFKTGAPPSRKQMDSGLSPQLTLTAAILGLGGFADIGPMRPGELVYVRIMGARDGGREEVRAEAAESPGLAEAALKGLRLRIDSFDDRETPYVSWAAPQFINQFQGDYDHLARLWEWHVIGEGEAAE
jgi:ATP-dependent helicase/nuclease subunit B